MTAKIYVTREDFEAVHAAWLAVRYYDDGYPQLMRLAREMKAALINQEAPAEGIQRVPLTWEDVEL